MLVAPAHPARLSNGDDLTASDGNWIEGLRVISFGSHPAVALKSGTALRKALDGTRA